MGSHPDYPSDRIQLRHHPAPDHPDQELCLPEHLLGLVFQLALTAQKRWRRLRGFKLLPDVAHGVRFEDGVKVVEQPAEEQQIAA